jgi:hypothetical protein
MVGCGSIAAWHLNKPIPPISIILHGLADTADRYVSHPKRQATPLSLPHVRDDLFRDPGRSLLRPADLGREGDDGPEDAAGPGGSGGDLVRAWRPRGDGPGVARERRGSSPRDKRAVAAPGLSPARYA